MSGTEFDQSLRESFAEERRARTVRHQQKLKWFGIGCCIFGLLLGSSTFFMEPVSTVKQTETTISLPPRPVRTVNSNSVLEQNEKSNSITSKKTPAFEVNRDRGIIHIHLQDNGLEDTVNAYCKAMNYAVVWQEDHIPATRLSCDEKCSFEAGLELIQQFLNYVDLEIVIENRCARIGKKQLVKKDSFLLTETTANTGSIRLASHLGQLEPVPFESPYTEDDNIPGLEPDDAGTLPWETYPQELDRVNPAPAEQAPKPNLLVPDTTLPPALPSSSQKPNEFLPELPQWTPSPTSALGNDSFKFNFKKAPWDAVLERFAEVTGHSLRIESMPPGEFNYIDPNPMSIVDAIDLLNSHLLHLRHLIVRQKKSLVVLNLDNGVPPSLIPTISLKQIETRGQHELISVALPVELGDAERLASRISSLLGPVGNVAVMPTSNSLLITDFGANLRRIWHLIQLENSATERTISQVLPLKHAPAEDVVKAINEFLTVQPGGDALTTSDGLGAGFDEISVAAELSTNSVLVRGSPRRIAEIARIVRELDVTPQEVLIHALLVEVELGNTSELGVELGIQDSVLFDRSVIDTLVTLTETVSNPGTGIQTTNQRIISQTQQPGFNFNNQPLGNNAAGNPGAIGSQGLSDLGLGRVNADLGFGGLVLSASSNSVSILIRALAANFNVDILSRPQIRTVDNREAQIQIGQQVPVVDGVAVNAVGSANPVIRQDQAGIILKVKPHIGYDGTVSIEATAEKSQFNTAPGTGVVIFTDATNGNVIEAPIKDLTTASTTVTVQSGQTIVLGGMITEETTSFERKVPYIGDIPVIGRLFRYDNSGLRRKELLIFLSPQIIDPTDPYHTTREEIGRTNFPFERAAQIHGEILPAEELPQEVDEDIQSDEPTMPLPPNSYPTDPQQQYPPQQFPPQQIPQQSPPQPGFTPIQNFAPNPELDPSMLYAP